MICSEDYHEIGVVIFDEIDVLEDSVGCTLEPLLTHSHLRRYYRYEMVLHDGRKAPMLSNMFDERLRFVLDEKIY
jgi:hypothetical protein